MVRSDHNTPLQHQPVRYVDEAHWIIMDKNPNMGH